WSCAAVSILTPGSTRGTPVALNPLKRPPSAATSEDLIISLDALAESLAAAMGYDPGAEVGARVKDVLFLTLQGAMKSGPWPSDIPSLVRLLERDPSPDATKFLTLLFRQARKYGVGVIVATQNVTDLDYKALGQASTWALGRLMAKQDLDRVRHVVASVHAGPAEKVLAAIPALRAGEFILLSPDNLRSAQRLAVRGLATRHEV